MKTRHSLTNLSSSSEGILDLLLRTLGESYPAFGGSWTTCPEKDPPRFFRLIRGELSPINGFAKSSVDPSGFGKEVALSSGFLNLRITIGEYCCWVEKSQFLIHTRFSILVVPNLLGLKSRRHALCTFLVLCDIKNVINIPVVECKRTL